MALDCFNRVFECSAYVCYGEMGTLLLFIIRMYMHAYTHVLLIHIRRYVCKHMGAHFVDC